MDSEVGASERGGRKRPSSQLLSSADINQETASVRSQTLYTAARYRFSILSRARIFIRPGPPPEEIQSRINAVIQHNSVTRPRKRSSLSPDTPPAAMPPPPPPALPKQDVFHVKTPRPDITAGLHHSTIVEALAARGLDEVDARDFLEYL
ncbi:unnamed protein product [Sphagnum balticum]